MYKFSSSALLVIDMQLYFLTPGADAFLGDKSRQIIGNALELIDKFRAENKPVIFTRHAHKKGESTGQMGKWWNNKLPWEGDQQSELIPELEPRVDELVITKTRYSAFEKTDLEKYLRKQNIETLVVCGVMTHLCVETTVRHGFILDFQLVIVEDACATQSEAHQRAALLNLGHGFAKILKTSEF